MTQEALTLALDALENHTAIKHPQQIHYRDKAIAAIKEALAQPEQEYESVLIDNVAYTIPSKVAVEILGLHLDLLQLKQEQEPVADDFFRMIADKNPKPFPLPQRTWVGLFDEEIEVLFQTAAGADEEMRIRFARAIEAKLKEINT
tara:strand:- start:2154 stop:2591 length:438 start_codon:yes stop_codon:yes gene_type:complete